MDSHLPLLYIDMVVDRNTGTIELLPSKNLKQIRKKNKAIGSHLVRCCMIRTVHSYKNQAVYCKLMPLVRLVIIHFAAYIKDILHLHFIFSSAKKNQWPFFGGHSIFL